MKKVYITMKGQPSEKEFCVVMFELESALAKDEFDLEDLAVTCVREYALTAEGRSDYERHNGFNWGNMLTAYESDTFRDICNTRGLSIHILASAEGRDCYVDMEEQLMDHITVIAKGIEWDSDDLWLPETSEVRLQSPLSNAAAVLEDEYGQRVKAIQELSLVADYSHVEAT